MRARPLTLAAVLCCVLVVAQSASAQVDVSASRRAVSTKLGDDFSFSTRITNQGRRPLTDWVAHLNVVGLSSGIYVDPEDWSSERTKSVPTLQPGESTSINWSVTAVTGGHAAIYVVALPKEPGIGKLTSSPAVDVRIANTKDFNSGGVLPLALGVPALLGLLTLATRRRRAR
jgi:uncharacterized membrane protein